VTKFLSLAVLIALLFVENVAAACNITLHVQVPTSGNSWTANGFYVQFGNAITGRSPAGATADAERPGWYIVDLSKINSGTGSNFLLARSDTTTRSIIDRNSFGTVTAGAATTLITCPAGADGGDYYIAEDPARAGSTYFGSTPPSTTPNPGSQRTFYFLPPNDPEWISSTPWFWLNAAGQQPQRMSIDANRCGWYKFEFPSDSPVPSGEAFILRSSSDFSGKSTYRIGLLGMTEDPSDWTCNSLGNCFPTPFDLSKQFGEISSPSGSRNLFFVAETGEWRAVDPMINETERCSYNFAAVIYDTDRDVNCSFNPNNNTAGWDAASFKKGVVQQTLDANRKLQFNGAAATERCSRSNESSNTTCVYSSSSAAPGNCIAGWNAQNFGKAWNAADTSNVVRCYDMPFQRSSAGLWEFNSNKLCRNGNYMDLNGNCSGYGGYLGGFFPNELQTRGDANYSKCPNCDKTYGANGWQGLASGVNNWCYERAWRGTGNGTGDLSRAQTAAEINAVMSGAGCTAELNGSTANLYSNTQNGNPGQRNFFFCFESHAEFTYEPGQEFFFSGDDDVWIFINNRLALDLGGVHSAVPGYIKLDTIKTPTKLVEGEKYPIDIFFCERNLNQSNIRITTNMYFSQQSGLYLKSKDAEVLDDVCLMRSGTGNSCEEMAIGGNKLDTLCGVQIRENLKYYLANRPGTAGGPLPSTWGLPNTNGIVLDINNEFCKAGTDGTGPYLLCYEGIKIYETLGKVQVLEDNVVGLVGTWRVWANYVGPVTPKPPPMRVAEFTRNAKVRVVWGSLLNSEGNNAVMANLPPLSSASTVAGRPVKVGFAVATETSANTFLVAMGDGGSPGQKFSLTGSSFSGISLDDSLALSRANLRVFADSAAQEELSRDAVFTIPAAGYLELWFTGNFEAEDDARYSINASGSTASSPAYVLDVYQPRLRFVDSPATAQILSRTVGSKPEGKTNVKEMSAWTGEQLERTLVAFDPTSASTPANWLPCGTWCNFPLRSTAQTYDDAEVTLIGNSLMQFLSGMNIVEGTATFKFVGMSSVEGDDFAYFKVYGPSISETAAAKWDSLQFQEPPVPTPYLVEIYDRKGGGRGDSLVIFYNKSFYNAESNTYMLPNYIEVFWDEQRTDIIGYGHDAYKSGKGENGKYEDRITQDVNYEYWKDFFLEGSNSIIVLTRDDYDSSFSGQRIKTAGEGRIVSWESFQDPNRSFQQTTVDFTMRITDKIPAVVVSGRYLGDERNCGTPSSPCIDQVTLEISEPIKFASEETSPEASKTAFAYVLMSLDRVDGFEVYDNQNDLPSVMRWRGSGTLSPASSGDSITYLTFRAYKSDNNTAYTPSAGDSVRFLATGADSAMHPFVDLHGNHPHPLEWGVMIQGKKRFTSDPIRISTLDPNDLDKVKRALDSLVGGDPLEIADFFTPERPIELIPVLPEWTLEQVRNIYPGSVGVVFRPDIFNGVNDFVEQQKRDGKTVKVTDADISFHARSYYHTNLGNFVVKRELTGESTHPTFGVPVDNFLKCSSPVFNVDGAKNCMTSASGGNNNIGVYLAWNLKAAPVKKGGEGRMAGAGAYVQVYDFWWEINVNDGAGNIISSGPLNKVSKIEMFGVKRYK